MVERSRTNASARPCVVLLGPPGSGKGTQAELLRDRLGVPTISTGDMLRAAVEEGNQLGTQVEGVMARGALVDDSLMAEVVRQRVSKSDLEGGFLLDGYPRTLAQAEDLERILSEVSGEVTAVVAIQVPEGELKARMAGRGRDDDGEDVIRERIRIYREKTEPLIGYYRDQGLLHEVDGNQTIDAVNADIQAVLSAADALRRSSGVTGSGMGEGRN